MSHEHTKHEIVYLHKWGAKIFSVFGDISQYVNKPNILIDPDYSLVAGRPPHHWANNNGTLGLLPDLECNRRDEYHKATIHQNPKIIEVPVEVIREREVIKEVIKEVPVEIRIPQIVVQYRVPMWSKIVICVLSIFIVALTLKVVL